MAIGTSAQDLRAAVPVECEQFHVILITGSGSLEDRQRCLLVPHVPQLEVTIDRARDEDVLCTWVDLDLSDASVVTLESLAKFRLGLSQVIQFDYTIFVSTEDELILIGEVRVESSDHLVIGEHTRLSKELLHVKHLQLVVRAPGDQRGLSGPRHRLHSVLASHLSHWRDVGDAGSLPLVGLAFLAIVFLYPRLWVDIPEKNSRIRIVNDLRAATELLSFDRVLCEDRIPTLCVLHQ